MRLLRSIDEGLMYPSVWWGFCWSDPYARRSVIAPIGINVVIAAGRWCWLWVHHVATDWLDQRIPKEYPL